MSILSEPATKAPWPPLASNDTFNRWPERYPVGKERGESFFTIAKKTGVNAQDLVFYNFRTKNPKEINWYLKNYVGSPDPGPGQQYYGFAGASYDEKTNKGVIFIPRFGNETPDSGNRLGQKVVDNYNKSLRKTPGGLCYEACYARIRQAAGEVAVSVPAFDNRSVFSRLWGSLIAPKKTWLELPEDYRGKGAAGAMVNAGVGTLVESADIWGGKLLPGAVLQTWKVAGDFDRVKDGDSPTSYGHSFIFLNYVYAGGAISGIAIADQGFQNDTVLKKADYGYWVAANLNVSAAP